MTPKITTQPPKRRNNDEIETLELNAISDHPIHNTILLNKNLGLDIVQKWPRQPSKADEG